VLGIEAGKALVLTCKVVMAERLKDCGLGELRLQLSLRGPA
jgi:hypothetical protein